MANPILGTGLSAVPVTALYGGLNALLAVGLAVNVSRVRGKYNVFRGDGGHAELQGAIRAHGNNSEHVPLGMMLLLIAELCGGSSTTLHVFGGAFLVARILHPVGLMKNIAPAQIAGALGSYLLQAALAVYVLWLRPWG
ncbi:MAPEG family protein [Archangium sp.]|uniref:MAPEG family protein n=1 Tax=Archangium sp. TaxID=1872627 RepID=UPI002D764762|nr:MAPEG family protein [Archangium sp.]HYO54573.1 MAPEG family protein [Archangium sp.]